MDESTIGVDVSSLSWQGSSQIVHTSHGSISVTVCGDRSKPALLTYHDVGLNHRTCFGSLFVHCGRQLLEHFCVLHVDALGHQTGASTIPHNQPQASVDDLADQVAEIVSFYGKSQVLALGVAAGGCILSKFAARHSTKVLGLVLVSPVCKAASWGEWAYMQGLLSMLERFGMTGWVKERLLERYFSGGSRGFIGKGSHVVQTFRRELGERDPRNVARFLRTMLARKDLTEDLAKIKCRTLIIVGEKAPMHADSLHMNVHLDKRQTSWLEVEGCGALVTEERPEALLSPFTYFLMGLGFQVQPLASGPRSSLQLAANKVVPFKNDSLSRDTGSITALIDDPRGSADTFDELSQGRGSPASPLEQRHLPSGTCFEDEDTLPSLATIDEKKDC